MTLPDLSGLTPADQYRLRWRLTARPKQITPPGDWWNVWALLSGRGFGKTRTASEDLADFAQTHPGARIAVVAKTMTDARDICIEGESGLLSTIPEDTVLTYNRSLGGLELALTNGTRFQFFSGENPDALRGPQFHRAWVDELAVFKYAQDTWDMLMFGLRLKRSRGHDWEVVPQALVTTTPKPITVIKELLHRAGPDVCPCQEPHEMVDVVITTGSTYENAENLASASLNQLRARYEGTTLGRQELNAEILDEVPGAYWQRSWIDDARVDEAPDDLYRVVIGVDPSGTSHDGSDECGILAVAMGPHQQFYVLEDVSGVLSPDGWGRRVVNVYERRGADKVVAEGNYGGDMVIATLTNVKGTINAEKVNASRGKAIRAEPVAALYEQGRVHHVGRGFSKLEDEQATWTPDLDWSPNRLDALVWAMTELMDGTSALDYLSQLTATCRTCGALNIGTAVRCTTCKGWLLPTGQPGSGQSAGSLPPSALGEIEASP